MSCGCRECLESFCRIQVHKVQSTKTHCRSGRGGRTFLIIVLAYSMTLFERWCCTCVSWHQFEDNCFTYKKVNCRWGKLDLRHSSVDPFRKSLMAISFCLHGESFVGPRHFGRSDEHGRYRVGPDTLWRSSPSFVKSVGLQGLRSPHLQRTDPFP